MTSWAVAAVASPTGAGVEPSGGKVVRVRAGARGDERRPLRAARAARRAAAGHPGGQVNARPPMRWKWRWSTDWPPHVPTFVTIR